MIHVIQHPDSLSLLGNLKHLTMENSSQSEVTMQMWLGVAEASDALVTHTYSPDSSGMIDVDVKDIAAACLSTTLQDLSEPYAQSNVALSFSVRLTCGTDVSDITFTVVRAGIANFADTAENFLRQNFLTWQPTLKPVTYYTPEFLTYYAQEAVSVKCRAYTAGGSAIGTVTLASIPAGSCYTIPTGYAVIAGKVNTLPGYYDVWVENGSGQRLTYKQRYYAEDIRSEQEEWILFENSLGGIDTFRAYGDSQATASHEHKVAEIEDTNVEYRVDTERKYKKSTGHLDKHERRWLLDFFPSKGKYIYADQLIRKIVVTDSDVNYSAKDLPSEYNFTYQLADTRPYLNLPRTDIPLSELHIEVPDVGSFTVAPRLVEFPRQELSGGALFPVQNPYSQQWGTTTFAALLDLISQALGLEEVSNTFLSRIYDDSAEGHITFEQGLTALRDILLGDYAEGLRGGKLTSEGYAELERLWVRTLATIGDGIRHRDEDGNDIPALRVRGDSTFSGNLSSPEFISNFIGGKGWAIQRKEFINAAGETEYKYVLEIDGVNVRETLRVYELVVSQLLGENDNRIFTAMMEVHHYDPETGKVWMNTNSGKLYNVFRPGDYILVQQFQPGNDVVSGGTGYITKHYELIINEVGTGGENDEHGDRLDWVTISNFTPGVSQEGTAEELIAKGDTFCRVDSLTDSERKGIIQMITVGTNAPYMDVLYGLKTDPDHALKARLGNLQGIRTDDFGWLQNFGIYTNNIYATGMFRNSQTGESLTAKISTTKEQHASIYKETTYDISEDDNHVSNGFFVRELEKWTPCDTTGTNIATQGTTGLFNSGGTPLMVNGQLISVGAKQQAVLTEYDGVPMLKLYGAGVKQSFADMNENTTHKELTTEQGSETQDVSDTLYMGIRILPVTSGTLKVEFLKQGAQAVGWQRTITDTGAWMTVQAYDTAQEPWDFTGTGTMVVSYTGQCLIRFIALVNDPVESLKVDYWTKITQTSRLIKAEANATYATRTMHSELSIEVGRIGTEVTNNKAAADLAKQQIESRLGVIETFDNNTATWITQTSGTLGLWATNFDANGNVKDLAQLRIDVNSINTTIGTLATTAAMNSYVQQLQDDIEHEEDAREDLASSFNSYKNSISLVVGQFDLSTGELKNSSSLMAYIKGRTSFLDGSANIINFTFSDEWNVFHKDGSGNSTKVMWLDTSGDLHITGDFHGGNITDNVTIGSTNGNRMVIEPLGNYGARLVGYNANNNTTLSLGFLQESGTMHGGSVSVGTSALDLRYKVNSTTYRGLYTATSFGLTGSGTGSVYCHANTEPTITLTNGNGGLSIYLDSAGHVKIGGSVAIWNKGSQNGAGYLYVDSDGYVKLAT